MPDRCESCGLLMLEAEEHGAGNPANPRCRLCTRPDGSFLDYDGTLRSHILYLQAKTGAGPDDAAEAAREVLRGGSVWKDVGGALDDAPASGD